MPWFDEQDLGGDVGPAFGPGGGGPLAGMGPGGFGAGGGEGTGISGPIDVGALIGPDGNPLFPGGGTTGGEPAPGAPMATGPAATPTGPATAYTGVPSTLANPFLLGFETSKLFDPNKGPGSVGKYTPAAKAFGQTYLTGGASISRGNLGPMVAAMRAQGFNARAVGDDKIDFGDGNGPIDVIGSDESIRFQNTTDNAAWEASHPDLVPNRPGGGPGGPIGDPIGMGGGGGWGGGGGGGGARPTYNGPDFVSQDIEAPTAYNPQAIGGPDQWQAMMLGDPEAIRAQQIQAPDAITAERIMAANPYRQTTEADLQADPGYQIRQRNTLAAIQNSAAMKGLLRTGGTMYDIGKQAGELASEEFGNVDARRFRDYQTDVQNRVTIGNANNANAFNAYDLTNRYGQGAALANQAADLSAQTTTADMRQRAALANASNSLAAWQAYQGMRLNADQFNAARTDTAAQNNFQNAFSVAQANNANKLNAFNSNVNAKLGFGNLDLGYTRAGNDFSLGQGQLALGNRQADQSYDLGLRNNALGYYTAGNSYDLGRAANQLGWANYGLNEQGQGFNQAYSLASLGLNAAGMMGGYAGGYGANAANNATAAGNVGAAGRVGSANAWNAGIGGAANTAANAYALWASRRPRAAGGA